MNELLAKIELQRYSLRSPLYPVFAEKDLQSYYNEIQEVFSIRFDAVKAKEFAQERAEVERDINYEPTEKFYHLAFVSANAWADFARHEDVYDQMIEANIAVLHGKETIEQARKRIHGAQVEVSRSSNFYELTRIDEQRLLKLMHGAHLYKSRGVTFPDDEFEIRPEVEQILHASEYSLNWADNPHGKIYLKRLSDKFQSNVSRTDEAFF